MRSGLREHKGNGADAVRRECRLHGFRAAPRSRRARTKADHPAIVAETRVDIPEASVSDAVMLMDLRNTNALMFKNSASGEFNMIYRREDGNIGWVEPPAR